MNWKPYIPTDSDRQESPNPWAETNGCMVFATVHCIEIQEKYLFGVETDYSEQILCVESGTNPKSGNSETNVFNTLKKIGLVKTSVSPEPENFTVSEFYTPKDRKIVATGQHWLNQRNVTKTSINPASAFTSLNLAPVLITIDLNPDGDKTGYHQYHEVVLINENEYFDSYGALVKPLTYTDGTPKKIYFADLLLISPKTMSNAEFYHKAGTKEYGIALPKLSEDALKDMAMNCGINILNADGTINFAAAKEVQGL